MSDLPTIPTVMADPCVSNWLKNVLNSAMNRDPVDAANDADLLAKLLDARCNALLSQAVR